jgi:hypothetical protein
MEHMDLDLYNKLINQQINYKSVKNQTQIKFRKLLKNK